MIERDLIPPVRRRAAFSVPADHPALAGHFPGNPLVPGVLLLEQVLDAAIGLAGTAPGTGAGAPPASLPQVKFLAPLQPGTPAEVLLEATPGRLRFRVEQRGRVLAQGIFGL